MKFPDDKLLTKQIVANEDEHGEYKSYLRVIHFFLAKPSISHILPIGIRLTGLIKSCFD